MFTVAQIDSNGPLALPRTEADMIASTLPEPTSASTNRPRAAFRRTLSPSEKPFPSDEQEHASFEDEDFELIQVQYLEETPEEAPSL